MILEKKLKRIDFQDEKSASEALQKCIKDVDQKWTDAHSDLSGTTAILAVHWENHLYTVNVGDSVCMLMSDNSIIQLNHEQSISDDAEQERLRKLAPEIGVIVVDDGNSVDWENSSYQIFFDKQRNDTVRLQVVIPPKLCTKFNSRSLASIALSSSIGDPKFGPILTAHPQVTHQILNSHGFLFLGSDGFFDVISKEELSQYVKKYCSNTGTNTSTTTTTTTSTTCTTTTTSTTITITSDSNSTNSNSNNNNNNFAGLDLETAKTIVTHLAENLPQVAWEKYGPKDYVRDDITLIVVYV